MALNPFNKDQQLPSETPGAVAAGGESGVDADMDASVAETRKDGGAGTKGGNDGAKPGRKKKKAATGGPANRLRKQFAVTVADIEDRIERLNAVLKDFSHGGLKPSEMSRSHLEPLGRAYDRARDLNLKLTQVEKADAAAVGQDLIGELLANADIDADTLKAIRAGGGSAIEQLDALKQALLDSTAAATNADAA